VSCSELQNRKLKKKNGFLNNEDRSKLLMTKCNAKDNKKRTRLEELLNGKEKLLSKTKKTTSSGS
jgi:hypothetical protein